MHAIFWPIFLLVYALSKYSRGSISFYNCNGVDYV
jgi:hypothetical protein